MFDSENLVVLISVMRLYEALWEKIENVDVTIFRAYSEANMCDEKLVG